ncbi:hypothetical protein [Flagellimonas iocasae]|uniref:Uncharacterized protein n=1 Tax=Flagellimonas iocasae TaxID=2055905 RepID=A0ABW4Y435_9FLAO
MSKKTLVFRCRGVFLPYHSLPIMRYFSILTVAFYLLISCSSSEDSGPVSSDKVKIEFEGIPYTIEVSTKVDILIQSETNVSSTLYINDIEVSKSNNKSISFTIDPFDYPLGANTLKIVSIDQEGNKSELAQSFTLKRLLCKLNRVWGHCDFVAVHTLDGKLVEYKSYDGTPISFYADDDYDRQNLVVTSYQLNTIDNRTNITSYFDVEPGTENLGGDEYIEEFWLGRPSYGNTQTEIQLSTPSGTGLISSPSGVLIAPNGNLIFTSVSDGSHNFLYEENSTEDFFLFSVLLANPTFENKYVKLGLDDFLNDNYSAEDFLPIENFKEVAIENIDELTYYSVRAYENYEAVENIRFHVINYDDFRLSPLTQSSTIRTPLFDDFEIYRAEFIAPMTNNARIWAKKQINPEDVTIDLPLMNLTKNSGNLTFTGDTAYTFSELTYTGYLDNGSGNYTNFRWNVYQKFNNEISLVGLEIEHPQEILEYMNLTEVANLSNSDPGINTLYCSLHLYEKEVVFKNMMFGPGYYSNQKGDQYIYSFPDFLQ